MGVCQNLPKQSQKGYIQHACSPTEQLISLPAEVVAHVYMFRKLNRLVEAVVAENLSYHNESGRTVSKCPNCQFLVEGEFQSVI